MATPSIVEIAPRGDIVLACGSGGDDCTKLRVESKVLTLASPVFQAMLDEKKYQEGTTLASHGFVEIPLPDDDPTPTTTICQILHTRFDILGEHLRPKDLVDIGIVADKYDCGKALSGPTYFWFSRLVDAVDDKGRAELFIAAYLLKQDQLFCQLSHDMVMKSTINVLSVFDHAEYPSILRELADALDRQRVSLAGKIVKHVEAAILLECGGLPTQTAGNCTPECRAIKLRGAGFVAQLASCRVWPLSAIPSQPLQTTCKALCCVQPFKEYPHPCIGGWGLMCKSQYMKSSADYKQELYDLARETEQHAMRLCLKCVQSGDIQQQGRCGKNHSK